MSESKPMIPLDEAFRIVDETLANAELPTEKVPVREAIGRTLASDQVSRLDLPPFNKSAMDGYAILADDERDEYRVLETVAAGQVGAAQLSPGTTVKVMTGAPVPDGAGRVIMVEDTEADGDVVTVLKHRSAHNICWEGEDVRAGDTVMTAGVALTAVDIANLIACGIVQVEVVRQARLAIICTGDEVVDSPELLQPGKIMNANGPLLAGLCAQYGLEAVGEECVRDDREAIAEAVQTALARADVVVISGGVSAGDYDFVVEALSDAGLKLHFSRVAVKPGKPMTYASGGGKAVFGLPGNPVSAYVTFHLFVLRAVALMSGATPGMREVALRLARHFRRRKVERTEYVPARLCQDGTVAPVESHGPAHLMALTHADGFLVVPAGVAALAAGDEVAFAPLMSGGPCARNWVRAVGG